MKVTVPLIGIQTESFHPCSKVLIVVPVLPPLLEIILKKHRVSEKCVRKFDCLQLSIFQ
jgi:hypothetical protein